MTEIVAELGASHDGQLDRALAILDAVADAGVDAIKLQTWADTSMVHDMAFKLEDGPWAGRTLGALYKDAWTPWAWHSVLFERARERGIGCFSSVFDLEALQFLEGLGCPRYKIASFELVDLGLIRAVAETGKPLIISTGMGTAEEIGQAVYAAREGGAKDITLLHCTSAYPAEASAAHLKQIAHLRHQWTVKAGLSDHTQGIGVAVVAGALGARMIEKHVKLDQTPGLDSGFAVTVEEMGQLVTEVRRSVDCIGINVPYEADRSSVGLRRSLYFAKDLQHGTAILREHLCTARPALGLKPCKMPGLMGQRLTRDVCAGEPVTKGDCV